MTARILVVDDVPANVRLLEARLLAEYFDVLTADDGAKALAICESAHVDLVLLDVMMPGIDGFEVCERLKENPQTENIPVVIVSALNRPSDRVRGLKAGADDFLTKPVNDIQLIARIKSLVRQRHSDRILLSRPQLPSYSDQTDDTARTNPRIFLIDARAASQERIKKALQPISAVYAISDPATALFEASKHPWDLILVNTNFRDHDPLRLCAQLLSLKQTRHVPILIMVEEGAEDMMVRALELGVDDYLLRPIDPAELTARCENLLRKNTVAINKLRAPMETELPVDKALQLFNDSHEPSPSPFIYDVRGNTLEVIDLPALPIDINCDSAGVALDLVLQKGNILQDNLEHSNIHYRLIEIFREQLTAARSKQNVISLGLINIECHAVLRSLDNAGEVPAALAGSLTAQCQMVKLYVNQFDEWKRFEGQAERTDIGPEVLTTVTNTLVTLGDDLAKQGDGVDEAVPKSIQLLTSMIRNPVETSVKVGYAAVSTLEGLCFAVAKYCSDFLAGTANNASKQLQKVLGTGVAFAAMTAAISYSGTVDIASRAPWLKPAIAVLKKYVQLLGG